MELNTRTAMVNGNISRSFKFEEQEVEGEMPGRKGERERKIERDGENI